MEEIEKTLEKATLLEDLTNSLRQSPIMQQYHHGGIRVYGRNTSDAMYSIQSESFTEEASKAYRDSSTSECR